MFRCLPILKSVYGPIPQYLELGRLIAYTRFHRQDPGAEPSARQGQTLTLQATQVKAVGDDERCVDATTDFNTHKLKKKKAKQSMH